MKKTIRVVGNSMRFVTRTTMEESSQERKKRKKLTDQIHTVEVGCPLSGTLFIFGIEILALAIKKNPKIEGIRVGAREVKIT